MTIDERLDRLAERHESLTQAVELMIHMQQEAWARNDAAWAKNDAAWAKNEAAWAKNEARWATTNDLITQVVQAVDGLTRIANSHEQRISDLEERRP
jgi:hypothetical protein